MNFLDIYRSAGLTFSQPTVNEILATNEDSKKYGLLLSPVEAYELIEARNQSIRNLGRVETGIGVVQKIIQSFCSSPYINADDYVWTLIELVETFYYVKNETDDMIGDDELIGIMEEYFNSTCQGSVDLLRYRELTKFAAEFRQPSIKLDDIIDEEQL